MPWSLLAWLDPGLQFFAVCAGSLPVKAVGTVKYSPLLDPP